MYLIEWLIDWLLTSTYSAQMSMLPTKSQTWLTVHELISSLCAWHLLWDWWLLLLLLAGPGDEDALLWARDGRCCGCVPMMFCELADSGEPTLRTGLGDSIFNRLPIGVDELKSNGELGRPRSWLFRCGWSLAADRLLAVNGTRANGDFCMYDRLANDWLAIRLGDCWRSWLAVDWLLDEGELCRFEIGRLAGPLRICCNSASFAARACILVVTQIKRQNKKANKKQWSYRGSLYWCCYGARRSYYYFVRNGHTTLTKVTSACVLLISIKGGNTVGGNEIPGKRLDIRLFAFGIFRFVHINYQKIRIVSLL